MYKIINDKLIQKGDTYIPRNEDNKDYRQFVEDVVGIKKNVDQSSSTFLI